MVKEKYHPFPTKKMDRTLNEIIDIVRYVFSIRICYGQSTTGNLFFFFNLYLLLII